MSTVAAVRHSREVIGKAYHKLIHHFGTNPEAYWAFSAGFIAGQAEKVSLGACPACMFRPSPEKFDVLYLHAGEVADAYGLCVTVLDSGCETTPKEIWLHQPSFRPGAWLNYPVNSSLWHSLRAQACGIPISEVDTGYHLRSGYGEKCD